ncbi:MAG: tetratricopeptide repeat protein [Spirochaetes bacterium]|nr:tetratricopeptide repeat protein [Spirochaetota bacterium]
MPVNLQHKATEDERFVDKLERFVHRRQIIIWAVLIIMIGAVVTYFIWSERNKRLTESSTILAEEGQDLYFQWLSEKDEKKKGELEDRLLEKLKIIIRGYPHQYGGQRALFIRGNFYFNKQNWEKAAGDYIDLSKSFPGSYLAEISLYNAGASYEELGKKDEALKYYGELIKKYKDSPLYPRTLFSMGRIYEVKSDYTDAVKYYNKLEDDKPSSNWTKLARNRMIYLKINKKIKEE